MKLRILEILEEKCMNVNVEEYEELVIPAGGTEKFNINIVNNLGSTAYYGIWYWVDSDVSSDVEIGKLEGTDVATSGEIANNNEVTVSIAVINNSSSKVKLRIGVGSSTTSTSDIEYLSGKKLITGTVSIPKDIMITSIKIDGIESDSLPISGAYTMTYSCPKGSTLSWNTIYKNIWTKYIIYKTSNGNIRMYIISHNVLIIKKNIKK